MIIYKAYICQQGKNFDKYTWMGSWMDKVKTVYSLLTQLYSYNTNIVYRVRRGRFMMYRNYFFLNKTGDIKNDKLTYKFSFQTDLLFICHQAST